MSPARPPLRPPPPPPGSSPRLHISSPCASPAKQGPFALMLRPVASLHRAGIDRRGSNNRHPGVELAPGLTLTDAQTPRPRTGRDPLSQRRPVERVPIPLLNHIHVTIRPTLFVANWRIPPGLRLPTRRGCHRVKKMSTQILASAQTVPVSDIFASQRTTTFTTVATVLPEGKRPQTHTSPHTHTLSLKYNPLRWRRAVTLR